MNETTPTRIYRCEDCGCRVAIHILNGPTEPMPHHYLVCSTLPCESPRLAAGGGEPFVGCCPICGETGISEIRKGVVKAHHRGE
jgi:hypothetical protein